MYTLIATGIIVLSFVILRLRKNTDEDMDEQGQLQEEFVETTKLVEENKGPELKERLKRILHDLGFRVVEREDSLTFSFDGVVMVILLTDDASFLNLMVSCYEGPNVRGELILLRAANYINLHEKYIKAYLSDFVLCLIYEREVQENEVVDEDTMRSMIYALAQTYYNVDHIYNQIKVDSIN